MNGEQAREEWQRVEQEKLAKSERMCELARSVGPESSVFNRHVVFKTWQEALDFKSFCSEQGLEVFFTEPAQKSVTWMDDYYHVYPKQ